MRPLHVLLAEDSDDDCQLVQHELRAAGYTPALRRVDTALEFQRALAEQRFDIVVSDYTMPQFDALAALALLQQSEQREVPFVVVSGSIGELRAVEALKAGAANYVMKDNLDKLAPVIERELRDAQMRRERSEAFEALRQAVQARDSFLAIASHELKTPLTALNLQIEGALEALQKARGDEATATALRKVQAVARSAHRLTELVERLLEVAEVKAGRLELAHERVDLRALVDAIVLELAQAFRAARAQIDVRGPAALDGSWDRARLRTVLHSLLANAAKFSEGKPVIVDLEDDGDTARVAVIDHGRGIPEPDQGRLFERFERAVPERHFGGFGVSLWLSRRIVEAHGGRITLVSAPGAGSTFTVSLPKNAEPVPGARRQPAAPL